MHIERHGVTPGYQKIRQSVTYRVVEVNKIEIPIDLHQINLHRDAADAANILSPAKVYVSISRLTKKIKY
jgi:hypothetical protein